jgi:hypothetical protein
MSDWSDLFNGTDLSGWSARGEHTWRVAGGVSLHPENDRLFAIEAGTGVMVNGDDGRTLDIRTDLEHGSCELHLEFCIATKSNSGVYLAGQFEIQILDSYGIPDSEVTYQSHGAIYPRWRKESSTNYEGYAPRKNASRPAGEWQKLEVLYHAPRFDDQGTKVANARFERVTLNGEVIHEDVECTGPTRGAWSEDDIARGPLRLQGDHGPVAFRNVRLRSLD